MKEALLRIRKICKIKLENYVILNHLNALACSFSSSRFEGQGVSNLRFFLRVIFQKQKTGGLGTF